MNFAAKTSKKTSAKPHHLKQLDKDTFVLSGKNMNDEKYTQVSENFNKDAVLSTIKKRVDSLPMMMDNVFLMMGNFISGDMGRKTFAMKYQDEMVPLYKRIDSGYKNELYKENYKPEIIVLNSVSDISDKYLQNSATDKAFDSTIETLKSPL